MRAKGILSCSQHSYKRSPRVSDENAKQLLLAEFVGDLYASVNAKPKQLLQEQRLLQNRYSCFCDTASTKAEGQLRLPMRFLMHILFFELFLNLCISCCKRCEMHRSQWELNMSQVLLWLVFCGHLFKTQTRCTLSPT